MFRFYKCFSVAIYCRFSVEFYEDGVFYRIHFVPLLLNSVATLKPSLAGTAVGGGLGAVVLIVLVIVGAIFVKRRWTNKAKGSFEIIIITCFVCLFLGVGV